MTYDKNKPYNELPLLPPSTEIETKAILKKAISANRALANLKGSGKNIPNQTVLVHTIGMQEAKLSSEIENIVTTNDDMYQALSSDMKAKDPHTKEVLHYSDALWEGYLRVKERPIVTTNLCIDLVNIIKENTSGIRNYPGTKIATPEPEKKVIYTPPEGEDILRNKMANLEEYINVNDADIDPLIKMAIIHYQFEAIHPFSDGNGRVGRIINVLYLILNDLLDMPVLYLSKYIIEHKNDYYKKLRLVTEKREWESWVLYMLDAVEETAKYTQSKVGGIYDLIQKTKRKVRSELPKIYSRELIDVLFDMPYCKIKFLEDNKIAKRETASKYLKQLSEIGVLKSVQVGKEKLFVNKKFYELLRST